MSDDENAPSEQDRERVMMQANDLIERVLAAMERSNHVSTWPEDEQVFYRSGKWVSFSHREELLLRMRAAKAIKAIREFKPSPVGNPDTIRAEAASQAIEDLTVKLVRTRIELDAARATLAELRAALTQLAAPARASLTADPEPIATGYSEAERGVLVRAPYAEPVHPFHRFFPRPGYSQNEEDYR